jgi:general secretion pathway protein F
MKFELKVLKGSEKIGLIALDAMDAADARLQARNQGYTVLSARPTRSLATRISSGRSNFPLVLFSQELLSLLTAGLSLIEALEALAEKERHAEIKKVYDGIVARLYEGQTFSSALSELPGIFPPLYIATVRASEKTGGMTEALARFVTYQLQLDLVRKKIISASIYPALLLGVGGLVVVFLMGYVVPKFSAVYEGSNTELPWMSRLLLQWGTLLETHGMTMLLLLLSMVALAAYTLTRPAVRERLLLQLWRIPALGERMHIYQLARFYRTLAMLLKGGTPIVNALGMVSGLLQPSLRACLEQATTSIREGNSISHAMERNELTTPVALRMLRVGERTGNMGEMMERIAAFYDEEMARWVEWFTKLFEPILMALIGVVIGAIVILMYMPVFDLAGNIQ